LAIWLAKKEKLKKKYGGLMGLGLPDKSKLSLLKNTININLEHLLRRFADGGDAEGRDRTPSRQKCNVYVQKISPLYLNSTLISRFITKNLKKRKNYKRVLNTLTYKFRLFSKTHTHDRKDMVSLTWSAFKDYKRLFSIWLTTNLIRMFLFYPFVATKKEEKSNPESVSASDLWRWRHLIEREAGLYKVKTYGHLADNGLVAEGGGASSLGDPSCKGDQSGAGYPTFLFTLKKKKKRTPRW
jgi:hypothetical protein